jgi:predicted ATPase/transcriptional regulator with XRE-family HTH domain
MNESPAGTTFGDLLRRLRKRAGMTQGDLAGATGYSSSLIGALEHNRRLPDVEAVVQRYLPALGLQDEPLLAAQLVELAALARGERPPSTLAFGGDRPPVTGQEGDEEALRIPVPPTGILGRDSEIRDLVDRFLARRGRLLTLVGPPGVGKTRLAQAVGLELQRFYRDGACFVPLAPVSDPALVASSLLSALRVYEGPAKSPQTRLIEHLRRKELLLVLDNFEQLISGDASAVELVAELLAECPGLCLLITSRERLHLRSEQRYQVEPLALPAAVELFVERCSAVDAEFDLTAANRVIVDAICEQLDRLPLALELCAAQIDLLSPEQLLARLQDRRFALLVDGAQDLPPRQRTLHNAIAHSYGLLDEDEARLLRSLAVFAGGCDLEAIEAVSGRDQPRRPSVRGEDLLRGAPPGAKTLSDSRTGGQPRRPSVGGEDLLRGAPPGAKTLSDSRMGGQEQTGRPLLQTLHALVGKSLVRVESTPGGAGRYLLLETIREFALQRARAEGEEDALRERHYTAYLRLFRAGDAQLRGPEAVAWLARLDPEQDNLRAALQWALDRTRYADAGWLILAVSGFWYHIGRWRELSRWAVQLLPHRETFSAAQRLAVLITLHAVSRASEEFKPSGRYTDELVGLLELCPDKALHATAWHQIANHAANFGEASAAWEQSIACARAALKDVALPPMPTVAGKGSPGGRPAEALPEPEARRAGLRPMPTVAGKGSPGGRPADALPEPEARRARLRPMPTVAGKGSPGGRPADAYPEPEAWPAGPGPASGVVMDREYALATPLWAYAYHQAQHGEFERAASLLEESARIVRARGASIRLADILGAQGRLALLQGDMERAHTLLREAVSLGHALNHGHALGAYQSELGLVTLYRGDLAEARRLLGDALRICLDLNEKWFLARVCTYLAETALWEGELQNAEGWLAQSLAYCTHRPLSMVDQIERILVAARLAAAQGTYTRAATLFGMADAMCHRIHYELAGPARRLNDAALEEVRAALTPQLYAEAFAAGQQLSLEEAFATILAPASAGDLPLMSSIPK